MGLDADSGGGGETGVVIGFLVTAADGREFFCAGFGYDLAEAGLVGRAAQIVHRVAAVFTVVTREPLKTAADARFDVRVAFALGLYADAFRSCMAGI